MDRDRSGNRRFSFQEGRYKVAGVKELSKNCQIRLGMMKHGYLNGDNNWNEELECRCNYGRECA